MQSLLQSCLIEMSFLVMRPFRMLPCYVYCDRAGYKVTVPVCVAIMSVLFAADTVGP